MGNEAGNAYLCGAKKFMKHLLQSALALALLALSLTSACQPPATTHAAADSTAADTAAAATATAAEAPELTSDRKWNDLARLLGGLPAESGSVLTALDTTGAARLHRQWFDMAWAKKRRELLDELHVWSKAHLASEYASEQTAFYPFSGSDYVTLSAIYPKAKQSVFVALEWEGTVPNPQAWTPAQLAAGLDNFRVSLDDVMSLSFYKTKDMYVDLQKTEINGHGPRLLAFLARTGHRVIDVVQVKVNAAGGVERLTKALPIAQQSWKDTTVTGWQIRYVPEGQRATETTAQTLTYWSVDVSDYAQPKQRGFAAYLAALKPTHTYIKSASYLLHRPYFSQVRKQIIDLSTTLLQDDSGLPLAQMDSTIWNISFYGRYVQPIPLFGNLVQPKLAEIYRRPGLEVVPFGIGYHTGRKSSNLQLLRKRK
jgi:hypothetical protein